jgi:hypothetical protein
VTLFPISCFRPRGQRIMEHRSRKLFAIVSTPKQKSPSEEGLPCPVTLPYRSVDISCDKHPANIASGR